MKLLLAKCKSVIFETLGAFLFSLGLFRLITGWVDRFQLPLSQQKKTTFPYIQKRSSRSIQILTYHGVGEGLTQFLPRMCVKAFENQMNYLASYCQVMDLGEAVSCMKKNNVPERAVVLTFDDGYKDMYQTAFPILKRFGLRATCFLPTDVIGTGRLLWHDRVCWAVSQTPKSLLVGFGSLGRGHWLSNVQEKHEAKERILWYLRTLDDKERTDEIQHLFEELNVSPEVSAAELMLSWDEVRLMYQNGIRFGSHTITHPILSKLSLENVWEEIYYSRKVIQKHLNDDCLNFAYPSGRPQDFTPEIKILVKEAGYTCAVSTIQGSNSKATDPYELRRLGYWDNEIGPFGIRFEYNRFCL